MAPVKQTKPNTWLISNSTFYFASEFLEKKIPLNIYSIWDLCNLSEAILFAEKITTIPGLAEDLVITKLKKAKIMEDMVDIRADMDGIVLELQGSSPIKEARVKQDLTNILCDIFPTVNEDEVAQAISKAYEMGDEIYDSPDWGGRHTRDTIMRDLGFQILKCNESFEIPKPSRMMLVEVYLRSILYYRIAAIRELNYYPDSIRLPIVAYLNRLTTEVIIKYVPILIQRSDSIRKKQIVSLNKSIGSKMYEVECPAALSMIIKQCNTREEFLDKALEIRTEDEHVVGFRKWLTEMGDALLNQPKKFTKMDSQAKKVLHKKEIDLRAAAENSTIGISTNGMATINIEIGRLISSTAEKFNSIFNPRRKSLIFLHNMSRNLDQIAARKRDFDRLFGRSLSTDEHQALANLRIHQANYLHNLIDSKTIA